MIEKLKMLVDAEKLLENLYNNSDNSDLSYSFIENLNSGGFKDEMTLGQFVLKYDEELVALEEILV